MKNVFFSGINGIGMSGLALILKNLGYCVSGSDIAEKGITKTLRDNGIEVFIGQKLENVKDKGYDTYVYSTAIKESNPEYSYMKEQGITMYRRVINNKNEVETLTDSMKVDDPRLAIQLPQDVISAGLPANPRTK